MATANVGSAAEEKPKRRSPNEELVFGFIGCGIRFHNLVPAACEFGPAAALADVDAVQRGRGVQSARLEHYKRKYPIQIYDYEDYRRVLDNPDVDAVVIATPDHWHTKIAVEALQAGKAVYCEKPLTLTIEEGKLIREALAKYPQVFQVGTQQRNGYRNQFAQAVAMVRDGRVGAINRLTVGIGGSETCDPIPEAEAPKHLNWDMWLGQAPMVPYLATPKILQAGGYGAGHPHSRTHKFFRWWYEYSGGKLTDWGAHHVDIALWAVEKSYGPVGKVRIEPRDVVHPVGFDDSGMPTTTNQFNTAIKFMVRITFEDGLEMDICDEAPHLNFGNGIMFEGEKGRFFVNRGKLTGKAVEELKDKPLAPEAMQRVYGREVAPSHMGDFVDCIKTDKTPVSDPESHHRMLSICHAVNIAMRLGRTLTFDTATEMFVGDEQANSFVARERRAGYEITV